MKIPIERQLSDVIRNSEKHCGIWSNVQIRRSHPQEHDFGENGHGGTIPNQDRFQETMETFTSEFNMRLSQDMDTMLCILYSQINRAISSTLAERVLPEIQNIVSSMSSSRNSDTESGLSPDNQGIRKAQRGLKPKVPKTTAGLLLI